MGRSVFITSFKGGVGKTTLTAVLASALTVLGKTVLVVDADYGNRCMDLVLGLESRALFDGADLLCGRARAEDAVLRHGDNERLFFLAAPASFSGQADPAATIALLERLKAGCDFVLVDSSAEDSALYRAFARSADDALVVTFHQSTAVRAAEKTASLLASLGFANIRMVLNCYRRKAERAGELPGVYDIIQRSRIQLIGVVPYDEAVSPLQERGALPYRGGGRLCPFEAAVLNTARRLLGEPVPLLQGVFRPKKLSRCLKGVGRV